METDYCPHFQGFCEPTKNRPEVEKSNLSNVTFFQALEEAPKKSETPEVVPVDENPVTKLSSCR